uniref:Uncharacterized protein n=1 Tax=uncultured marine crenarchaeote AD1000-207-H3 TaxID=526637 RepID=B3V6A5_9ARCH|nr:hypothetical protein [uncultured marine crenarchaeote AD1000-207-H3]
MSDTRFIILGVGLIFTGIIILTVFGDQIDEITLQEEFRECYEYHADAPPTEIDCDVIFQNKMIIFAIVALLIICGIASLVKGIRGRWDQDVKPEDMVGPNSSFDTHDGQNDSDQNDTK